jgi:hypothetical protein
MAENGERVLHMRKSQQLEILSDRINITPLIKNNGSELSGDELKTLLKDIIHSNKHKNLRGSVTQFFVSGLKLNKSSEEALIKRVQNAYTEMRYIAERTPNTQSARNEREVEATAAHHGLLEFRRNRNASRNREASNARHREFTIRQGWRNSAASIIQRGLSRRLRRQSATNVSARPALPAIRSSRIRSRSRVNRSRNN